MFFKRKQASQSAKDTTVFIDVLSKKLERADTTIEEFLAIEKQINKKLENNALKELQKLSDACITKRKLLESKLGNKLFVTCIVDNKPKCYLVESKPFASGGEASVYKAYQITGLLSDPKIDTTPSSVLRAVAKESDIENIKQEIAASNKIYPTSEIIADESYIKYMTALIPGSCMTKKVERGEGLVVAPALKDMTFSERVKVLRDISDQLRLMHANTSKGKPMMHGDINPTNIHIHRDAKDGSVKASLLDFGFSRYVKDSQEPLEIDEVQGFPGFIPPECALQDLYVFEKVMKKDKGELVEIPLDKVTMGDNQVVQKSKAQRIKGAASDIYALSGIAGMLFDTDPLRVIEPKLQISDNKNIKTQELKKFQKIFREKVRDKIPKEVKIPIFKLPNTAELETQEEYNFSKIFSGIQLPDELKPMISGLKMLIIKMASHDMSQRPTSETIFLYMDCLYHACEASTEIALNKLKAFSLLIENNLLDGAMAKAISVDDEMVNKILQKDIKDLKEFVDAIPREYIYQKYVYMMSEVHNLFEQAAHEKEDKAFIQTLVDAPDDFSRYKILYDHAEKFPGDKISKFFSHERSAQEIPVTTRPRR